MIFSFFEKDSRKDDGSAFASSGRKIPEQVDGF